MAKPSLWISNPAEAHRAWREGLALADRAYAEQTQRQYLSLFGRFCVWLAGQQCDLRTIAPVNLAIFLDSLKGRSGAAPANRTQRMYVAEIDRVMAHLQNEGLRRDNPARTFLETLRITTPLRPRSIKLAPDNTRDRYLGALAKVDVRRMAPEQIQSAAMNLLMLDCGLTLKELQKLLLQHVEDVPKGVVRAPGHRLLIPRPVDMSAEAKRWLKRWLAIREKLTVVTAAQYRVLKDAKLRLKAGAIEGGRSPRRRVFVSFAGKSGASAAGGLRSTGLVIDRLPESTIYLSAQEAMLAGRRLSKADRKAAQNKGPQALRTLCCARLVEQGLPAREIADFLGLHREDQVWAMSRHLKGK